MNTEFLYFVLPPIFQITDFVTTFIAITYFGLKEVGLFSRPILQRFGMGGLLIFKIIISLLYIAFTLYLFTLYLSVSNLFLICHVLGWTCAGLFPSLDNLNKIIKRRHSVA